MNNIISLIANLDYNNEIRSNPFVHILYSGNQNDLCQMLISVRQILNIFAQQNLQLEINSIFYSFPHSKENLFIYLFLEDDAYRADQKF
ncbi:unnamed protein product [Rotaria sp. Silwood1]|nr:unnamed protein product [Rotaria sp. Silwood1]CAF4894891.1 unnamed protein product [Rotaria sp. Silwood1]